MVQCWVKWGLSQLSGVAKRPKVKFPCPNLGDSPAFQDASSSLQSVKPSDDICRARDTRSQHEEPEHGITKTGGNRGGASRWVRSGAGTGDVV